MKEFFAYFFGQGETIEFTHFSVAHFVPIAVMLVIMGLIAIFGKKIQNFKHEDKIRLTLAFIMIICEMSYFWRLTNVESLNANPVDHLPITVCGWAIIFCSFLVLSKNQTLFDIAYFWVFAGSIFGLLTPTVISYCGPTRFRYYQFWLEHTMGFITLFYMIFVHKMRPNIKSMIKAYVALLILGGIAITANTLLPGANYLYVARPEETASILDFLPKNYIVRLILMALIIATLFFVFYLPWFIKDLKAKKKELATATATLENNEVEKPNTIASAKMSSIANFVTKLDQAKETEEHKTESVEETVNAETSTEQVVSEAIVTEEVATEEQPEQVMAEEVVEEQAVEITEEVTETVVENVNSEETVENTEVDTLEEPIETETTTESEPEEI